MRLLFSGIALLAALWVATPVALTAEAPSTSGTVRSAKVQKTATAYAEAATKAGIDLKDTAKLIAFGREKLKADKVPSDSAWAKSVLEALENEVIRAEAVELVKKDGLSIDSELGQQLLQEYMAAEGVVLLTNSVAGGSGGSGGSGVAVTAADDTINKLSGLGFGAGLGVVADFGTHMRVKSATLLTNGIVRVTKDNNVSVGFLLETHYFIVHDSPETRRNNPRKIVWGWGPFVGARLGDNVIDGAGLGIMVGFKRPANDGPVKSFNLGFGYFIEPDVQILGDGIYPNQPLPAGDNQVRFRNTSQSGVFATFSASVF